jgi:uncharacterized membrane protein/uncharacterized protein (DUF58 family)
MIPGISVTFSPIFPWPVLSIILLVVTGLTVWAYRRRLLGQNSHWAWVALGLRLTALFLCLMAALRPSLLLQEKKRQAASVVLLLDSSSSMSLGDEVNGKSRWDVGLAALDQAKEFASKLGPDLDAKSYRFDTALTDPSEADLQNRLPPKGRETRLGAAMLEAIKRQQASNRRIARMIIFSDFASNNGINPLVAARQLKGEGIPVVTVGLGTENAGAARRDIVLRDIVTNPTVFVKNQLEVRGNLLAPGFGGQTLDVELKVEGQSDPVARVQVKVPESADVIPITGLKYIPQSSGEKLLTLAVAHRDGELLESNNQISTFVTVLAGGLNVLFLQGPNISWENKYLMRAIASSPDIQVEGVVVKSPVTGGVGSLDDAEFASGRYNVYILSDLRADYLTPKQQSLMTEAVFKGAGLMMLGGRNSFGSGGWADTPLVDILPVNIHPGDGQLDPEGGVRFVPTARGLDAPILQVGANRQETERIWHDMHPVLGTNRFGEPKNNAAILAETNPGAEPLLVSVDVGKTRSIAYGGDTWVWARSLSDEGRNAHRKFWRQAIFWLAHKEDDGDNQVKLNLLSRRLAVGEKLDMTVTARDSKGAPITDVTYVAKVEREGASPPKSAPVEIYNQGTEGKGLLYATENTGEPGTYSVTVTAKRGDQEIGHDTARFLVYQDDRELENPSADLSLARQIAVLTGGESITPERLGGYLKGIDRSAYTEYLSPSEYKVWDNWPFLLLFATLLTLEWFIRKRLGWV